MAGQLLIRKRQPHDGALLDAPRGSSLSNYHDLSNRIQDHPVRTGQSVYLYSDPARESVVYGHILMKQGHSNVDWHIEIEVHPLTWDAPLLIWVGSFPEQLPGQKQIVAVAMVQTCGVLSCFSLFCGESPQYAGNVSFPCPDFLANRTDCLATRNPDSLVTLQ